MLFLWLWLCHFISATKIATYRYPSFAGNPLCVPILIFTSRYHDSLHATHIFPCIKHTSNRSLKQPITRTWISFNISQDFSGKLHFLRWNSEMLWSCISIWCENQITEERRENQKNIVITEVFQLFVSVVSKLTVAVFISLYFKIFWPKWLNFFQSFQKHFDLYWKNSAYDTNTYCTFKIS